MDSAFVLPFWALLPTPPREAVGAGRLRPVSERQRTGRSGSMSTEEMQVFLRGEPYWCNNFAP